MTCAVWGIGDPPEQSVGEVNPVLKMPPNGADEWRARIGHWENRKLRWYQAHCGSRPRVPLHLHLERAILDAPLLCVLLLLSLVGKVETGVREAGSGTLSSLGKLTRCCTSGRRVRVCATPLLSLSLALSLLLVVAGDVETNPGPISGEEMTELLKWAIPFINCVLGVILNLIVSGGSRVKFNDVQGVF